MQFKIDKALSLTGSLFIITVYLQTE